MTTTAATDTKVLAKKEPNLKRLDKIITQVIKDYSSMKKRFEQYCIAATEEGLTPREAWEYIRDKLKDVVPKSTLYGWSERILPPEAKQVTKPRLTTTRMSKEIPDSESLGGERSTGEKQEVKGDEDPNGYKIEQLDEYDSRYLREIVKHLHRENEQLRKKLDAR